MTNNFPIYLAVKRRALLDEPGNSRIVQPPMQQPLPFYPRPVQPSYANVNDPSASCGQVSNYCPSEMKVNKYDQSGQPLVNPWSSMDAFARPTHRGRPSLLHFPAGQRVPKPIAFIQSMTKYAKKDELTLDRTTVLLPAQSSMNGSRTSKRPTLLKDNIFSNLGHYPRREESFYQEPPPPHFGACEADSTASSMQFTTRSAQAQCNYYASPQVGHLRSTTSAAGRPVMEGQLCKLVKGGKAIGQHEVQAQVPPRQCARPSLLDRTANGCEQTPSSYYSYFLKAKQLSSKAKETVPLAQRTVDCASAAQELPTVKQVDNEGQANAVVEKKSHPKMTQDEKDAHEEELLKLRLQLLQSMNRKEKAVTMGKSTRRDKKAHAVSPRRLSTSAERGERKKTKRKQDPEEGGQVSVKRKRQSPLIAAETKRTFVQLEAPPSSESKAEERVKVKSGRQDHLSEGEIVSSEEDEMELRKFLIHDMLEKKRQKALAEAAKQAQQPPPAAPQLATAEEIPKPAEPTRSYQHPPAGVNVSRTVYRRIVPTVRPAAPPFVAPPAPRTLPQPSSIWPRGNAINSRFKWLPPGTAISSSTRSYRSAYNMAMRQSIPDWICTDQEPVIVSVDDDDDDDDDSDLDFLDEEVEEESEEAEASVGNEALAEEVLHFLNAKADVAFKELNLFEDNLTKKRTQLEVLRKLHEAEKASYKIVLGERLELLRKLKALDVRVDIHKKAVDSSGKRVVDLQKAFEQIAVDKADVQERWCKAKIALESYKSTVQCQSVASAAPSESSKANAEPQPPFKAAEDKEGALIAEEILKVLDSSSSSTQRPMANLMPGSPLRWFKSFRLSQLFADQNLPLSSSTFSNNIDPYVVFCPYDLTGECYNRPCQWQHSADYLLSSEEKVIDLLSYHPESVLTNSSGTEETLEKKLRLFYKQTNNNLPKSVHPDEMLKLSVASMKKYLSSVTTVCLERRRFRVKSSSSSGHLKQRTAASHVQSDSLVAARPKAIGVVDNSTSSSRKVTTNHFHAEFNRCPSVEEALHAYHAWLARLRDDQEVEGQVVALAANLLRVSIDHDQLASAEHALRQTILTTIGQQEQWPRADCVQAVWLLLIHVRLVNCLPNSVTICQADRLKCSDLSMAWPALARRDGNLLAQLLNEACEQLINLQWAPDRREPVDLFKALLNLLAERNERTLMVEWTKRLLANAHLRAKVVELLLYTPTLASLLTDRSQFLGDEWSEKSVRLLYYNLVFLVRNNCSDKVSNCAQYLNPLVARLFNDRPALEGDTLSRHFKQFYGEHVAYEEEYFLLTLILKKTYKLGGDAFAQLAFDHGLVGALSSPTKQLTFLREAMHFLLVAAKCSAALMPRVVRACVGVFDSSPYVKTEEHWRAAVEPLVELTRQLVAHDQLESVLHSLLVRLDGDQFVLQRFLDLFDASSAAWRHWIESSATNLATVQRYMSSAEKARRRGELFLTIHVLNNGLKAFPNFDELVKQLDAVSKVVNRWLEEGVDETRPHQQQQQQQQQQT